MRKLRRLDDNAGHVLMMAVVMALVLAIMAGAFLQMSGTEVTSASLQNDSTRAFYYAEAGLEYAAGTLRRGWNGATFVGPFEFVDAASIDFTPAGPLAIGLGDYAGTFDVEVLAVNTPYEDARDIVVRATGTYRSTSRSILATLRIELEPSKVFDYMYFMNHWSWLYVDGMTVNGNVRASGDFSFGGHSPMLNGHPDFSRRAGADVLESTGGVTSTHSINGAQNVNGMGGLAVNQHEYEDANGNMILDSGEDHDQDLQLDMPRALPMPNLSDATLYEDYAKNWNDGAGSSIKIQGLGAGGTDLVVSNAVYGDELGERQHLCLIGTLTNPILLDGPVVVRGDVIIKGYVKGKGTIYSNRNVYIPDDLRYVDGPTTDVPTWTYGQSIEAWQAASAAWRQANQDRTGLGLFARENIILDNYKDSTWRSNVSSWLNNSLNESKEDLGLDGLPNTNDPGEGDGEWTVDYYTQDDYDRGLIPPGKVIGDVIPGSGEDIDGDGTYDGRISLTDFEMATALNTTNWGGNLPAGATSISDLDNPAGPRRLKEVYALMYTNHALAGQFGYSATQVKFFGGWVSRVEATITGTSNTLFTHDERFTGGGKAYGFILPRTKSQVMVVTWREVADDYQLPAE
jgi:hypothetical protein